jgi:hypothetical protein
MLRSVLADPLVWVTTPQGDVAPHFSRRERLLAIEPKEPLQPLFLSDTPALNCRDSRPVRNCGEAIAATHSFRCNSSLADTIGSDDRRTTRRAQVRFWSTCRKSPKSKLSHCCIIGQWRLRLAKLVEQLLAMINAADLRKEKRNKSKSTDWTMLIGFKSSHAFVLNTTRSRCHK